MLDKMPTLYVGFVFNWNLIGIQTLLQEQERTVNAAYKPLLDVLEKHYIRSDHFISGYSSLRLAENFPGIVDRVKEGIKEERFELGTYTHSHPVVPLIPYEDTERQINMGLSIDQKIWGVRPEGFLLPELAWDPVLTKVLQNCNINWVVIANTVYRESVEKSKDSDLYLPIKVEGLEGGTITAVQASYYLPATAVGTSLHSLMSLRSSPGDLISGVQAVEEINEGDMFVLLKADAEAMMEPPCVGIAPEVSENNLDRFLGSLERLPYVKSVTIGEYLKDHKPNKKVILKYFSPHTDIWGFVKGSEKTHLLLIEAREEIRNAKYSILLAKRMKADVKESEELLEEAWKNLLVAEASDGTAPWRRPAWPTFVCEQALKASGLARKAVEEIKFG